MWLHEPRASGTYYCGCLRTYDPREAVPGLPTNSRASGTRDVCNRRCACVLGYTLAFPSSRRDSWCHNLGRRECSNVLFCCKQIEYIGTQRVDKHQGQMDSISAPVEQIKLSVNYYYVYSQLFIVEEPQQMRADSPKSNLTSAGTL